MPVVVPAIHIEQQHIEIAIVKSIQGQTPYKQTTTMPKSSRHDGRGGGHGMLEGFGLGALSAGAILSVVAGGYKTAEFLVHAKRSYLKCALILPPLDSHQQNARQRPARINRQYVLRR
jgi:hypothetical protein